MTDDENRRADLRGRVSKADRAAMRRLGATLDALDYVYANSELALALEAAGRGEVVGVKLSPDSVRRLASQYHPKREHPVSLSDAITAAIQKARQGFLV